jgi:hypothetical protein
MKMSETNHETALKRLGKAQREEENRLDERNASEGTARELRAENELGRAREETDARGRWLEWVDSDGQAASPNEPPLEELRAR